MNNTLVEIFSGFEIPSHLVKNVLPCAVSSLTENVISITPRYFNNISNFVEDKNGFLFINNRVTRKVTRRVKLIKSVFIDGTVSIVLVKATPSDIAKIKLNM